MTHALAAAIALVCLALAPPVHADDLADEGYELYLRGQFERAGEVFHRAAEGGDPAAQYMLGTLYALGQGVPRDATTAHRWLTLAAGQGDPLARLLLATVAGGGAAAASPAPSAPFDDPPPTPGATFAAVDEPPPPAPPVPSELEEGPAPRHVLASLPPAERIRSPFEAAAAATTAIAPDSALGRSMPAPGAPGPAAAAGEPSPASPATVAGIQRRLAALGYDAGPADGVAGARTRIAIRDFQRDAGLEIDGVPSPALDAALAAAAGEGGLVAAIQDRLARLGYPAGPADGVLRDATRRAMLDYYRASGVPGVLALDELARRLDAELVAVTAAAAEPRPRALVDWIDRRAGTMDVAATP